MSEWIEMPEDMEAPPAVEWSWAQIIEFVYRILRFVVYVIFPIKNIDAKLGVLIGDDAKRNLMPEGLPKAFGQLEGWLTTIVPEQIDQGVLAQYEHITMTDPPLYRYTGIYEAIRNLLYHAVKSIALNPLVPSPYLDSSWGELPPEEARQFVFRPNPNPMEIPSDGLDPDLLHAVSAVAAMLTTAEAHPWPTLATGMSQKLAVGFDGGELDFRGSLSDIVLSQEFEVMTRLEQFRQSNPVD